MPLFTSPLRLVSDVLYPLYPPTYPQVLTVNLTFFDAVFCITCPNFLPILPSFLVRLPGLIATSGSNQARKERRRLRRGRRNFQEKIICDSNPGDSHILVRLPGIEPESDPWQGPVLPLNHSRNGDSIPFQKNKTNGDSPAILKFGHS